MVYPTTKHWDNDGSIDKKYYKTSKGMVQSAFK